MSIFRVWIIEVRDRRSTKQEWCPTHAEWFTSKRGALTEVRMLQHPNKVYRVRRYKAVGR